ncbi:hypothetical protein CBR_g4495 [Chara braunii]|uniref:Reverse transcriptase domain-containing protein n=1 Tax=Chara braunii TaxID=69332 RepID=A0A388KHY4_CHABU|nr:hypothetical protein CBR_g4495 [Chara braunii]|eukprot:GBG69665.1 hypothetical protein CBR_g4495 [Chara braunii]
MNMTFQNFVNKTRLTQGMINFCVIVYMDDILVYSETYHGHAQHIEWTLGALRDAGFKIALEKSEFFLSEISFLGYVVTRGGLWTDLRKVVAVKEASVPTSLTQVRAFLGLASYYRRFIKGFAAIARPLTNLLRKGQPLRWDAECQQAFATLKDALAMAPILIRLDPSKQFILITDWQPEAISAIFAQKGNDGREHVIEYASRTVPDERRNDSAPQEWWNAYVALSFCLLEVVFHWAEQADKDEEDEVPDDDVELLLIQEWRTDTHGELLGILFGKVRDDHLEPITSEILMFLAQLLDDLPLDILSRCDERSTPGVLTHTLVPHLLWSTCTELDDDNCYYPSSGHYLVFDETDLTLWDPITRRVEVEGETNDEEVEEERTTPITTSLRRASWKKVSRTNRTVRTNGVRRKTKPQLRGGGKRQKESGQWKSRTDQPRSYYKEGAEIDGVAISMVQWLEDRTQEMLDVMWELVEGPDPQLGTYIGWRRADGMMGSCKALFTKGHNLRNMLEDRQGMGKMGEKDDWLEGGLEADHDNGRDRNGRGTGSDEDNCGYSIINNNKTTMTTTTISTMSTTVTAVVMMTTAGIKLTATTITETSSSRILRATTARSGLT